MKKHFVYSVELEDGITRERKTYYVEGRYGQSNEGKAKLMAIEDGMKKARVVSVVLEHPKIK